MPGSDVGRAGFGPATNGLPIGISQKDVRIPAFPCAPDSFTSGRVRCDEPDSGYFSGIGGECAATDKPRAGLAVRADPRAAANCVPKTGGLEAMRRRQVAQVSPG